MQRQDRRVSTMGWLGALAVGLLAVGWFVTGDVAATTGGYDALTPPVAPQPFAKAAMAEPLVSSVWMLPDHPATPTVPTGGTLNSGGVESIPFEAPLRAGAATGPGDCVGPNCSDFDLLVQNPGGKNVRVRIDWTLVTNDFDLYVYEQRTDGSEALVASSGAGATTFEEAVFTPTANTSYQIVIVHFASTGDNIEGVVSLVPAPQVTQANLIGPTGTGIVFSPNGNIMTTGGEAPSGKGTTFAPETVRDGEPSVRVDLVGNMYPAGIRGVPAGVDVWRFRPEAYCPRFTFHRVSDFPAPGTDPPADPDNPQAGYVWLGQPDGIFPNRGEGSPDAGGGDIELATAFGAVNPAMQLSKTNPPRLSMVSLTLLNITSAASPDRGNNWSPANPVAATVPLDDRQWIEAFGRNTVYLYYRTLATLTGLILNKSIDGGVTYAAATNIVNPLGYTPGWIDVDESPNPGGSVDIYLSAQNSSELVVFHCVDANPMLPAGITCGGPVTVDKTMSHGHIFDPLTVDNAGNVYASWSNNKDIFYAYSTDKGATWSSPIQVTAAGSGGGMPVFNIFPWITAGDNGRVGIVWYGTDTTTNPNDAEWKAYYAFSANARATTPTFRWVQASDQVIHKSNVSQLGLSTEGGANRNLIDFFQVADDPRDGAAVIAFADDHNDFDGGTYFTRQIAGPGMRANRSVTTPPNGCPALEPFQDPEVRDFANDVTTVSGTRLILPTHDVINIDFETVREGGKTYILADMAVGLFTNPPPPEGSWRSYFAVNTARGLLDSGDEYFVELTTRNGTPEFWLGTTDRDPNGGTAEQRVENILADQNFVDQDPGTPSLQPPFGAGAPGHVRVRVDISRLDWHHESGDDGPPVVFPAGDGQRQPPSLGEVVIGLRGRIRTAFSAIATSLVDQTRGGSCIILGFDTCIPTEGDGDEPDDGDEDQDDDGKDDEDEDDDDDNDGRDDDDDSDDDNDGVSDNDEEGGIEHDDD
jgi:hypothetical protein